MSAGAGLSGMSDLVRTIGRSESHRFWPEDFLALLSQEDRAPHGVDVSFQRVIVAYCIGKVSSMVSNEIFAFDVRVFRAQRPRSP